MVVKLLIPSVGNAALAIILYCIERKTTLKKLGYKTKQSIYGILFGLMAMYSSTVFGGVDLGDGTLINVRDAAPICAGLIFGAPAGIISGIIGGVFRYIAVFFGIAGKYTQVACSVSTVLVGFIAALLRKYMFDDKKPTWLYGLCIGMICEIIHMLMIFFTNMNDTVTAFEYVKSCTVPMVLGNGASVGIAVIGISIIGREGIKLFNEKKQISQIFQFQLFICIVTAYAAASIFTVILQTGVSKTEAESIIEININDVFNDINALSDKNLLNKIDMVSKEYFDGADISVLAEKYNMTEINIIDENGIIVKSNTNNYLGYDMSSGEQSAEFLVLLDGKTKSYIQDYRPTSYDNITYRKYGAVAIKDGGFFQVGYDAEQFRADLYGYVEGITQNRHIGNNGAVILCDEDMNIVGDEKYNGQNISILGMYIDTERMPMDSIFDIDIYEVPYLCAYRFAEGYYIIGIMPMNESMFMRDISIYVNFFIEIIIFAALFVLIYFQIKKIIIDNIRQINKSLAQITRGDLNVVVDVRSNKEFASLSDDINSTVSTLKSYIAEAAARIDEELEYARQIQYSSLPTVFPGRSEFEAYAQMFTAKEVGGDFYDFYMLSNFTIAFLIADVSGKGIPAAMFMMRAKTVIKDLAESGLEPDEIFAKANDKLCENNDAGMFVTAWLGILNLKTGVIKFANAGHNFPLMHYADGRVEFLKVRSGLVLAGMEGMKYRKNEIRLVPGDMIYLYTDGVTEAMDEKNELYGDERLLNYAKSFNSVTPEMLCKKIKNDVDRFVGSAPQFDDITMICIKLKCTRSDNEITVIPNEASMLQLNEFAGELVSKFEILPKISNKINIIFDEIYSNIINYSSAKIASVSYQIADGKLYITFSDDGTPYNPLENDDPDITLSAEERNIGGLGIFMVKKMTERMEYYYENNKNILKIAISLSDKPE